MAKSKKKAAPRAPRLGAEDWVRAGLVTLARRGVANVRVERLARDLKVTKGSFYWHFKDREALLDAMLETWRVHSSRVNEVAIERNPDDGRAQLRALLNAPQTTSDANEGSQIELALRLWARRDDRVSGMLRDMQRQREKSFTDILTRCGVRQAELPGMTQLLGATMLSLWTTDGRTPAERDALVNTMIEIVERYSKA
jgi:AcrR family transcriptional regulator